jgi:hypothetical protein
MQYADLNKIKVLKIQRDFMSDIRKPNSKSVLKYVIPVRPVLNIGQTSSTYPRASPVHRTCPVHLSASIAVYRTCPVHLPASRAVYRTCPVLD